MSSSKKSELICYFCESQFRFLGSFRNVGVLVRRHNFETPKKFSAKGMLFVSYLFAFCCRFLYLLYICLPKIRPVPQKTCKVQVRFLQI